MIDIGNPRPYLRRAAALSASLGLAALSLPAGAWGQTAPRSGPVPVKSDFVPAGKHLIDKSYKPALLASKKETTFMVELTTPPTALVFADARYRRHLSLAEAQAEADRRAAEIEATHSVIKVQLKSADIGATVIFSVKHAYNGIAIKVNPEHIGTIRTIAGVKDIHVINLKRPTAASAIDFNGTPAFWNALTNGGLGVHGENIKIASIDTGIDYIHTNFAGPGTPWAYADNAAHYTTTLAGNPYFPNSRVKGGYDFAGDAYDGTNIPVPDPVPFDGDGHGSATASVLAGSGVNADGTTYTGPYDSSTPLATMKIGPGSAPKADIYSLRVFGDTGDTGLVTEAVDWAVENHMDVISLSLGSTGGPADDPDTVAVDNATKYGIIAVVSAGNDGDNYYLVGGPSTATGAISVGGSLDPDYPVSYVTVNQPTQIAGLSGLFYAGDGAPVPAPGLSGDVVYAVPHIGLPPNTDGSVPALTNAASIRGHICLVDRGMINFSFKVQEAQNAGATAVLIANDTTLDVNPSTSTATFTPAIPNGIISQAEGQAIEGYLDPVGTVAGNGSGPVNVTLKPSPGAATDNIAGYSSRGPRESDGLLKPDVVSPAETIDMASLGTGSGSVEEGGTSFSCPDTAGAMALLRQVHPATSGWTVEQLKAAIMNTATHDLTVGPGNPTVIGIGRVGAGRMDLQNASQVTALAYSADVPGAVSVSYGVVDAPIDGGVLTEVRNVTVVNKAFTPVTFALSITDTGTDVPGVTFSVPGSITVPAAIAGSFGDSTDGTATFQVTMTADPTQMLHTYDPSINLVQDGVPREFLSEATKYIVLTPPAGSALRLPVHAMPRPVSDMHTTDAGLALPGDSGLANIDLDGDPIFTSDNFAPTDIYSFLKVLELQYIGTQQVLAPTVASANLQYVGLASDYGYQLANGGDISTTTLNFGIAAYGNHGSADGVATSFNVLIDSTGGDTFTPNYLMYNLLLGTTDNYVNVFVTMVSNLNTGDTTIEYPVNGYFGNLDTEVFNNSVLTLPIAAADVGLTDTASRFNYQVSGYYDYEDLIDETPILTYDPANPGLVEVNEGEEPDIDFDVPRTIQVTYDNANLLANRSLGALLLHLNNASLMPGATTQISDRADILLTDTPQITGFSSNPAQIGESIAITGFNLNDHSNANNDMTVTFFNNVPATGVASADGTSIQVTVPSGAITGTVRVDTASGSATSRQKLVIEPAAPSSTHRGSSPK